MLNPVRTWNAAFLVLAGLRMTTLNANSPPVLIPGGSVRWIGLINAVMVGHAAVLSSQIVSFQDSVGIARALAGYAVAHPIGGGGPHGAMTGLVVDSTSAPWDALVSSAVRQNAPTQWLDPSSVAARLQPHLRVQNVAFGGDSLVVHTVWSWCFSNGGGESVWPVTYVLSRNGADWRVETAEIQLIGHGLRCTVRPDPAH